MSEINRIEKEVAGLTKRVQRLHNGDWAVIMYHSGTWVCRCHFALVPPGYGDTPSEALGDFSKNLSDVERSEARLAQTLGVDAA